MKNKKKIIFFIPVIKIGGAEKVFLELSEYFQHEEYSVEILTLKILEKKKYNLKKINIVNLNRSRLIFSIIDIYKYLKKNKPKYVFSTLNHSNIIILILKFILDKNTKILIREANISSQNIKNINFLKRIFFIIGIKYLYPFADKIIAVTDGVKNDLVNNFKINKNKIITIHNPVNYEDIIQKSNLPLEKNFNPKLFSPYLVCVGSLTQQKNQKFLINVFSNVLKKINCYLIIIGSGDCYNDLKELSIKLKIENNIIFTGNVSNPYNFMLNSKGIILPSLWEGLPNVLIEALFLDIPIISSNSSEGVNYILKNGNLGKIYDINDDKQLLKMILEILTKKQIKNNNRDLFRFEKENITNDYLKLLDNIQ